MRWKIPEGRNLKEWHSWFAWYPVIMDGHIVWREYIQRRKNFGYYGDGFEYKNIEVK